MPHTDEPTDSEARELSNAFLGAAAAVAAGDMRRAADLLTGPPCDDDTITRRMFGLFAIGAVIAGRSMRIHMDPDDDSDGLVTIAMINGETGKHAEPSELPPELRIIMWSVVAGANLDTDAIRAHLHNIAHDHGYEGVMDGVMTFAQITGATMPDDDTV